MRSQMTTALYVFRSLLLQIPETSVSKPEARRAAMRMSLKQAALTLAITVAIACASPTGGCGCSPTRGHYAFSLALMTPDTLCLRLVARSATDSAVRDKVSVPLMLPPIDTVQVDFVLPEVPLS